MIFGNQTTSSEYTASPFITAETFRSLPPASKPMRQPSMCPPMAFGESLAAGSASVCTTSNGRSKTFAM